MVARDHAGDLSDSHQARRILAYAQGARGKLAYREQDWQLAIDHFRQAEGLLAVLLEENPADLELRGELTNAQENTARCLARIGQTEEAVALFRAVIDERKRISHLREGDVTATIAAAKSMNNLAAVLARRRIRDADTAAVLLLDEAISLLRDLEEAGRLRPADGSVASLKSSLSNRREVLIGRVSSSMADEDARSR
jgi:tetratricopeptide (TPR) repeat protein